MTHGFVLLLSLAGFFCLALSMSKHQRELLPRTIPPSQSRLLRLVGFLAIASALATAGIGIDGVFGPVAWFGHISLAAALVFIVLLWKRSSGHPRK